MAGSADTSRDEARRHYARMMVTASGSGDARLERVFAQVPREAFLGPGPWRISVGGRYAWTPSADPAHLYQNVLVALDADRGINNGEPSLHAALIGAAAPQPGETVLQIGAGTGYYTAILAMLVQPGGRIHAYEIDEGLALRARAHLAPYPGVTLVHGDATALDLPACDLIYVNAGVVTPPLAWLDALRPGGRLIVPWQPTGRHGLALQITRDTTGFAVRPLMPIAFIPCIGASNSESCRRVPSPAETPSVRSVWRTCDRPPDASAVAITPELWFSTTALPQPG